MTDSAGQFVEPPRTQDCSKKAGGWGRAMNDYEYIWYGNKGEDDYPDEACEPYYCLLYTSPSPRDATLSRMPSSA